MIFKILWHKDVGAKRFGYWIGLRYEEKLTNRNKRKTLIKKLEEILGPLGSRWNYQLDHHQVLLKLDREQDFLFLLLKLG